MTDETPLIKKTTLVDDQLYIGIFYFVCICSLGLGLFLLIPQVWAYLNSGTWEPKSFLHVFHRWGWFSEWIVEPDFMVGLHKILLKLNAGMIFTAIGSVGAYYYNGVYQEISHNLKKLEKAGAEVMSVEKFKAL